MAGRPRAFATVEELQQGIDAYFSNPGTVSLLGKEGLLEVDEPLSVSGLADALDVCRDTLHEYASGAYGDEYSDAIKRAIIKIERDKISKAMLGMYDRTIAIFDLKNNHGWKDQQHIEETSKREHSISEATLDRIEQASANVTDKLRSVRG